MKIEKKEIRKIMILVLALAGMLLIWPFGIMTEVRTVQTGVEYNHLTEPLSGGIYAVQDFVAQEKELKDMILMFDKNAMTSDAGFVTVALMDENNQELCKTDILISDIESYKNQVVELKAKLKKGERYRFSVQCFDTEGDGVKLVYRSKEKAGIESLGDLSYFGQAVLPDAVSLVKIDYITGLTWYQVLLYDSFIAFLALMLGYGTSAIVVFRN